MTGLAFRIGVAVYGITVYMDDLATQIDLWLETTFNIINICILIGVIPLYMTSFLMNLINLIDFFSVTDLIANVHFPSFGYYIKEDGGVTLGLFVFITNLLIRPGQITILTDLALAYPFALSQQFAFVGFALVGKPITILFEFILFYLLPFWDLPYVEWGKVLGLES
jgi:hypothetical protein